MVSNMLTINKSNLEIRNNSSFKHLSLWLLKFRKSQSHKKVKDQFFIFNSTTNKPINPETLMFPKLKHFSIEFFENLDKS